MPATTDRLSSAPANPTSLISQSDLFTAAGRTKIDVVVEAVP